VSWFALSLLSVTFLATTELTQQHLLNGKMALSPRVSTVLAFAIQSLMAVPFVLILYPNEIAKLFQEKVAFQILIVAALSYIGNLFYFQSFKVKNISLSAILVSFSVVMSTILGIIFFDESIGWLKFVGIGLVLAAIVGVNYRNIHLRRNHLFALGAGVIFGTCYALYNFFTFTAYTQGGEIGRVDAVNNSQIFLIILFEFLILRHQQQLGRKLAMAVLAYTGILILGLA
jgi:drug/metabolite transporter (DMT)-like permease